MWILTPTNYIQSKHVRYIHKYHLWERERERGREHTNIQYNSMLVFIYYIASIWILHVIQKQTQHKEKRGLEE